jgi:cytoskeletal protein RodZ
MNSDLKDAREKAGYTIEEVSDKLNIRKQYLISLEEGDFDSLPGKIYVEGYTKMYYDYLGLTLPQKVTQEPKCTQSPIDEQKINSRQRKFVLLISLSILIVVIFSYSVLSDGADEVDPTTVNESITYGNNQEGLN